MDWNLNNLSFSRPRSVLLCAHLISQSAFGEETRTDYKNPRCAQACCSTSPEQRAAGICRAVSYLHFRPECISVGNVQLRSQRWTNVARRSREACPACERMTPLLKKKNRFEDGGHMTGDGKQQVNRGTTVKLHFYVELCLFLPSCSVSMQQF